MNFQFDKITILDPSAFTALTPQQQSAYYTSLYWLIMGMFIQLGAIRLSPAVETAEKAQ